MTDLSITPSYELIKQLRRTGETLPEPLHNQLLAAGSSIAPALIELVEANLEDPDQDAWAAVHAARLLSEIKDERAIPVLLDCVEQCDVLDWLRENVLHALIELGDVVIGPCVARYRAVEDDDPRNGIAEILQKLEVIDERIYEILVDTLHRNPELGAIFLAEYGDPRALPLLFAKFDELPLGETGSPLENHVFIELQCAIEDLGGHLNDAQKQKLEQSDKPRQRFAEQLNAAFRRFSASEPVESAPAIAKPITNEPVRKQPKPGRNDPCWCGSGKKYKKCHLPLEQ